MRLVKSGRLNAAFTPQQKSPDGYPEIARWVPNLFNPLYAFKKISEISERPFLEIRYSTGHSLAHKSFSSYCAAEGVGTSTQTNLLRCNTRRLLNDRKE